MPAGAVRKLTLGLGVALFGCLVAVGTISATADSPSPAGSPGAAGLPGDPAKGQTAFNSANCAQCHGASLEGGVGPRLNPLQKITGAPDFKSVNEPQVADYLISTITNGKAPSDGFGQMPAKGGANLSDQDVKDIAAYIIQSNLTGKTPLGPAELARSNVFWVAIGIGSMVLLTYLLAQYNMRWIARRAAARRNRLG